MIAANYRHIGGGKNRLGRHYSRFAGIWPTSFLADQSLTLRKSQNAGSNRPSRVKATVRGQVSVPERMHWVRPWSVESRDAPGTREAAAVLRAPGRSRTAQGCRPVLRWQ